MARKKAQRQKATKRSAATRASDGSAQDILGRLDRGRLDRADQAAADHLVAALSHAVEVTKQDLAPVPVSEKVVAEYIGLATLEAIQATSSNLREPLARIERALLTLSADIRLLMLRLERTPRND